MIKTTFLFAQINPGDLQRAKDEIVPHPDPVVPLPSPHASEWNLVGPPSVLAMGGGHLLFVWTWREKHD